MRGEDTRQTTVPKIEKTHKQIQKLTIYQSRIHKLKAPKDSVPGYNWQIAGGQMWTTLRMKGSNGSPSQVGTTVLWDLPAGAQPGSHTILEKNRLTLLAGDGERNHFEIHHSTLFFLRRPDLGKLINKNWTSWDFIRVILTCGKGQTQLQPILAIPFHPRGDTKN